MNEARRHGPPAPAGAAIYQALTRFSRGLTLRGDGGAEHLLADRLLADTTELLGAAALEAGLDPHAELAWLLLCEASAIAGVPGDLDAAGPDAGAVASASDGEDQTSLERLFYEVAPSSERARAYFSTFPTGESVAAFRASRTAAIEVLWHTIHPPVELLTGELLTGGPDAKGRLVSVSEHLDGPVVCFACRARAHALDTTRPRSLAAASPDASRSTEFTVQTSTDGDTFVVRCVIDAGFLRCFLTPGSARPMSAAEYRLAMSLKNGAELAGTCTFPRDSYGGVNLGALHDMNWDDLVSFRLVRQS